MLSYDYIKGQNRGKHFQDTVESRPLGNLSVYYIGGCKHRPEFRDESLLEIRFVGGKRFLRRPLKLPREEMRVVSREGRVRS